MTPVHTAKTEGGTGRGRGSCDKVRGAVCRTFAPRRVDRLWRGAERRRGLHAGAGRGRSLTEASRDRRDHRGIQASLSVRRHRVLSSSVRRQSLFASACSARGRARQRPCPPPHASRVRDASRAKGADGISGPPGGATSAVNVDGPQSFRIERPHRQKGSDDIFDPMRQSKPSAAHRSVAK